MTIEEIKNNYAVEKGHEDWAALFINKNGNITYHYEYVIQLIQDELKKKIVDEAKVKICHEEYRTSWYEVDKESILNTENIK